MKCKFCENSNSKVIDSRLNDDGTSIRRRRECTKCGRRFTTFEEYETIPVLVVKSDGSRQPFDREKIKRGIIKACEKRPVTIVQIEQVVNDIEREVYNTLAQEVSTQAIGELVMKGIRELDQVAYIRFASVYRQFTDVSNFIELLDDFKNEIERDKKKSK